MRVLNTRPANKNDEFSARLEAGGHRVICSPMLEIVDLDIGKIDPLDLQGIVVTSRNALWAVERSGQVCKLCDVPVYAVGPASGRLAVELGFSRVEVGTGGARELCAVMIEKAAPGAGRIIHLCGQVRAFDIGADLAAHGFKAETVEVYRSVAASSLTGEAVAAITEGTLEAVIVMSARSGKTFVSLVEGAGLRDRARALHYACISDTAAQALGRLDLPLNQIHVASRPRSFDLLALVNRI